MTVEIVGCEFNNGECHIYAIDADEYRLQMLERNRIDDVERELEFVFYTIQSLIFWLKRQKIVNSEQPKSIGDAVRCTVGTVTTISGKYLCRE